MSRGPRSCDLSPVPRFPPTPFLPCSFVYRFHPSPNRQVFLRFPTRTNFRTEPSSFYPFSPLSLSRLYRKTRGGGRGGPSFSPLATHHSPLPLTPSAATLTKTTRGVRVSSLQTPQSQNGTCVPHGRNLCALRCKPSTGDCELLLRVLLDPGHPLAGEMDVHGLVRGMAVDPVFRVVALGVALAHLA